MTFVLLWKHKRKYFDQTVLFKTKTDWFDNIDAKEVMKYVDVSVDIF